MANISLIGFMGSGKTTVGRLLAERLGASFIDLDEVIEDKLNMRIYDVFSNFGESYFRDVESEVVREVLSRVDSAVIACGGGVVLRECNVEMLRKHSIVIYLRITPDEAYRRLKDSDDRPLLRVDDREAAINHLLSVREPLYLKTAHLVVEVDGKEPRDLVDEILKELQLRP